MTPDSAISDTESETSSNIENDGDSQVPWFRLHHQIQDAILLTCRVSDCCVTFSERLLTE